MVVYMEKVIEYFSSSVIVPIIVSIISAWVENRIESRVSEQKKIPRVHMTRMANVAEVLKNEEKIKENKHFIKISEEEYVIDENENIKDKKLFFKEISFKKLLNMVEEKKLILLEFRNLSEEELSINYIITDHNLYEVDYSVVYKELDKKQRYCLVCDEDNLPCEILGSYRERNIRYVKKNDAYKVHIKNASKRKLKKGKSKERT